MGRGRADGAGDVRRGARQVPEGARGTHPRGSDGPWGRVPHGGTRRVRTGGPPPRSRRSAPGRRGRHLPDLVADLYDPTLVISHGYVGPDRRRHARPAPRRATQPWYSRIMTVLLLTAMVVVPAHPDRGAVGPAGRGRFVHGPGRRPGGSQGDGARAPPRTARVHGIEPAGRPGRGRLPESTRPRRRHRPSCDTSRRHRRSCVTCRRHRSGSGRGDTGRQFRHRGPAAADGGSEPAGGRRSSEPAGGGAGQPAARRCR